MPCSAARTSWFCQRCTASSASSIAIQSEHAYRSRLGFFFALTKSIIEKGNCQVALSESYFFDFITLLTGTFVRNEARRIVRAAVIEDACAIHDGIRRLKMRLAHSVPAA